MRRCMRALTALCLPQRRRQLALSMEFRWRSCVDQKHPVNAKCCGQAAVRRCERAPHEAAAAFLKQLGLKLFMGFLLARVNRLRVTMPEPLLEMATWRS